MVLPSMPSTSAWTSASSAATSLSPLTTSSAPKFLTPSSRIQIAQVAGAKRGPSRFLGKTRSQILDSFMRSNARICAVITATFFPICAYWTWRYNYIIKPKREELKKVAEQELLAEGKYVAEKQWKNSWKNNRTIHPETSINIKTPFFSVIVQCKKIWPRLALSSMWLSGETCLSRRAGIWGRW